MLINSKNIVGLENNPEGEKPEHKKALRTLVDFIFLFMFVMAGCLSIVIHHITFISLKLSKSII